MSNKLFSLFIAMSIAAACAPSTSIPGSIPEATTTSEPTAVPTLAVIPPQEGAAAPATPAAMETLLVAFAKDGDLHLWDSESSQSRSLVQAGDITTVTMSDDGQVIAFLRRSLRLEPELMEYVSLWAIDHDGTNPRELVSADALREHVDPLPADSAGFAQVEWIPGTHRLVYSGVKFYAPGQGFTSSQDIYLVDADTGAATVLAADVMPDTPFLNAWRFVISPDGQQIALISSTALSFINTDGSNWRQNDLTYPQVGVGDAVLLPSGVWTLDSDAFVFTGPMQSESIFILNYTISRVPTDGSPAQSLAELTDSHSSSVTFSPGGKLMAFLQDLNGNGLIEADDYRILPLIDDPGPLAIPFRLELFYANTHWSPGGEAFVIKDRDLFRLCPDATNSSEVCGDPVHLEGDGDVINWIEWIDRDRFLFTELEPSTLSLGNLDGTITPIVAWTEDESLAGWSSSLVP